MATSTAYTASLRIGTDTIEHIESCGAPATASCTPEAAALRCAVSLPAVLFPQWMLQATRVRRLAISHHVSLPTTCGYVAEMLDALTAQAPGPQEVLLAVQIAKHP